MCAGAGVALLNRTAGTGQQPRTEWQGPGNKPAGRLAGRRCSAEQGKQANSPQCRRAALNRTATRDWLQGVRKKNFWTNNFYRISQK
eukprot:gene25578-biopygen9042